jgi:hypothetical protein
MMMAVGMLGWFFMFLLQPSADSFYTFQLPEDQQLVLEFSADLSFYEKTVTGSKSQARYFVEGRVRGLPSSLEHGVSYRCLPELISIFDSEKELIVHFERKEDNQYRYVVAPKKTDFERQQVCDLFHIDTSSLQSSKDSSLFQYPLNIFVTNRGQLAELILSSPLKNALHAAVSPYSGATLLNHFLSHSEKIPPLFALKVPSDAWQTEGEFLQPLLFNHKVKSREGNILTIHSRSFHPKQESDLPWLDNHAKKISGNEWKLKWKYDAESKRIHSLDLKFTAQMQGAFLNHKSNYSYTVDLLMTPQFEKSPLTAKNSQTF